MAVESVDEFIERLQTTLARIRLGDLVTIELSATDKDGEISLDKIEAQTPGQGHGKYAMRVLVSLADDFEYQIVAKPLPLDEATDPVRLVNWFKRCGFAAVGDGGAMVREPQWGSGG
jgi:hypothetical protein